MTLAVTLLLSCKSVDVYTYYDENADFSKYKTYAFTVEAQELPLDSAIKHHVLTATRRELNDRGFEETDTQPDLYIHIWGQRKTQTRVNSYTNAGGQTFSFDQSAGLIAADMEVSSYLQGSIWLELIDHKNGKEVWQGVGTGYIEDKYTNAINMIKAIQKMFKREPFKNM